MEVCLFIPFLDRIFKDRDDRDSFLQFIKIGYKELRYTVLDQDLIENYKGEAGVMNQMKTGELNEPKTVILSVILRVLKQFNFVQIVMYSPKLKYEKLVQKVLLEKVFRHIEESAKGSQSENSFAGLFDDYDVNSNKLGSTVAKRNERLVKLLDGIASMNLGSVKDHDIDAFGDAYEYLMTMYASNAGKSGGEFFTPADVSELLTRLGTVGKKTVNKVYDPACGSGSLLLKAEKVLGRDSIKTGFFGQEINITITIRMSL